MSQQECFFRVMERATEAMPDELDDLPVSEAHDLDDMSSRLCSVGRCSLTAEHVMQYMLASGDAQPRRELDAAVAPECQMLDVPHDSDAAFMRIQEGIATEGQSFGSQE